jgi:hypothetical protein
MLDDSIAEGCVICPVLEETRAYLHLPTAGDGLLVKDESWTPPADAENIISSDRSS